LTSASPERMLAAPATRGWTVTFRVERSGDRAFTLEGELDLETAPLLRETVWPALMPSENVNLDLRGLSFMGSDGLRVLLEFCKAIGSGHVVLFNAQSQVVHVLTIAGALRGSNLILGYSS